jgi:hypothetical protein
MNERLPWRRHPTGDGFIAYPEGEDHPGRCAIIRHAPEGALAPAWIWYVSWPKWFKVSQRAATRQDAADAATLAWWTLKQTPVPRDVEGEIAGIVAHLLTRPPPSDLLREDSAYLTSLMNSMRLRWSEELRTETLPPQVAELIAKLSAELFRRRTGGGR